MNFAQKLLSHHSSLFVAIPYLFLVAAAVGLQYLQMSRLNARNPQAAQANPQAAMLQKYMPLIFGFIYLNVAAILNVYFIVSSAIRILTQEILFRKGLVAGPPTAPTATPPAGAKKGPAADRSEKELPKPKASGGTAARKGGAAAGQTNGKGAAGAAKTPSRARAPQKPGGSANGSNGRKPGGTGGGNSSGGGRGKANGTNGKGSEAEAGSATPPKDHPRSKAKRERKAR
jgi:hypothetical protein